MRATVHTVAGLLLEKGANPNELLQACIEAISKEMESLQAQHEGDGTFPQAGANA
jgi:proline dehydrogenase